MISLVYVSSAIVPFTEAQLVELLATSRANNNAADISGMLVYKDGNFMQLLEGQEDAVDSLKNRITKDRRHCGMVELLRESIEERRFPDWSMGFRNLRSPELRQMPGFSEFLNYDLTGREFREDPSRAQKLLLSFKKSM